MPDAPKKPVRTYSFDFAGDFIEVEAALKDAERMDFLQQIVSTENDDVQSDRDCEDIKFWYWNERQECTLREIVDKLMAKRAQAPDA